MGEKGFATIFALCLILATALVFKGIQESETNHTNETANFLAEAELQNAADSAIYIAVETVRLAKKNGIELLPKKVQPYLNREEFQHDFDTITRTSEHFGTITVESWGEQINIHRYNVSYGTNDEDSSSVTKNFAREVKTKNKVVLLKGYLFFSVAEATNEQTGKKIYRRALAYVLEGSDDTTINFMEVPMSSYKFKN